MVTPDLDMLMLTAARQGIREAWELLLRRYAGLTYLFVLSKQDQFPTIPVTAIVWRIFDEMVLQLGNRKLPFDFAYALHTLASRICGQANLLSQTHTTFAALHLPISDKPLAAEARLLLDCIRPMPSNYQIPVLVAYARQIEIAAATSFLRLAAADFQLLQERGLLLLRERLDGHGLSAASQDVAMMDGLKSLDSELQIFAQHWLQREFPAACERPWRCFRQWCGWLLAGLLAVYLILWVRLPAPDLQMVLPLLLGMALGLLGLAPMVKLYAWWGKRRAWQQWQKSVNGER